MEPITKQAVKKVRALKASLTRRIGLPVLAVGILGVWLCGDVSAQPSFLADTTGEYAFKGKVRKLVQAGDAAYRQEQYIVSTDRYNRALTKEKNEAKAIRIYYKMGLTQQKLNHPEAAYNSFNYLWSKGERSRDFLRDYMSTLFAVSHYAAIDSVLDTMAHYRLPVKRWRDMLALGRAATDSGAPVYPKTVLTYDSALNTAFSEYGCVLLDNGELVFTSTRPLEGETVMDPRTGHSYSRLYSASYQPETKTWGNPQLLQGPFKGLHGNIGTFSYDAARQIGYFMWSQVDKSGVYTVKRQSDGSWGELAEFKFNHYENGPDFVGKAGQPSVSPNGNRLLFVVKDASGKTGTDIWYMERVPETPPAKTTRKRKVASPSSRSRSASSKSKSKAKPADARGELVQLNKEWGGPVRLDTLVNTNFREAFPQWLNDTCFVFASDGFVGMGGLDLYIATFNKKRRQASKVKHIPAPVNSSFDDHGLVWDSAQERVVFASNRYTRPGHRDNLYIGPDYLLFPHPDAPIDSTEIYAAMAAKHLADSLLAAAQADSLRIADSIAAAAFAADSLRVADSLMSAQRLADSLMSAQRLADSLRIADSLMMASLAADSTNFSDSASLMAAPPPPLPDTSASAGDTSHKLESIFGMAVVPTGEKQDLTQYLNDSMSAKEIIAAITTHRKDVARVDSRYVNDYKKRMNDPLRRTKLQVVPPGVKCEVCEDKTRQRPADKPFFVRTNDDKALITLTDQAGKVSYIDVAPNAAYQIEITTMGSDGKPSLPKSVEMSDLRRTVVTRDYVLFECTPKLAELNDEAYVNNLYFDFDGDSLVRDAFRELDRMIIIAIKNPNMMFEIEAHADERGSAAYNQALTDRRLESTKAYVEKKGFDTDRIVAKSYGKSRPLIRNARTEEEHRLNRRVSFRLFNPEAENELAGTDYPLAEVPLVYSDQVYFKLQLGAFRHPLEDPLGYYQDVLNIDPSFKLTYYMDKDGLYKYNIGDTYADIEQVRALVRLLLDRGRECYIAAFYQGNRITVAEALAVLRHQSGQ